jgi:hypothetical protein
MNATSPKSSAHMNLHPDFAKSKQIFFSIMTKSDNRPILKKLTSLRNYVLHFQILMYLPCIPKLYQNTTDSVNEDHETDQFLAKRMECPHLDLIRISFQISFSY